MTSKLKPAPAAQDPVAGGRYKRNADGSLAVVHQTQPVEGRSEASRRALAERLAAPATPNTQE